MDMKYFYGADEKEFQLFVWDGQRREYKLLKKHEFYCILVSKRNRNKM